MSNGATAHIPPTPVVFPQVQPLPSSVIPDSKELPPTPPERSIRRKELQPATMGHKPSKSELERNDSFHSQKDGKSSNEEAIAAAPSVKRKAVPESGVRKFVSLLELKNGPRGGKPTSAPTSAPRETSAGGVVDAVQSSISVQIEIPTNSQIPPTPPDEKAVPSPPRKALMGIGLPSNPRTKQPMSPLHARGKSSTGFNILKVLIDLPFPSPVFLR